MDFEALAAFVASLSPAEAGMDALTRRITEQAAAIASSDNPVEAFGRVVEGVREDKLRFMWEVAICNEAIPVLTKWRDARESAVRGIKEAERAAEQVAIDAVIARHAAAVRRADDEHAAAVASLTEKRNADIAAVLDMVDAEPVCGLLRAVGRDAAERGLVAVQEGVRHLKGWTGKERARLVYDSAACDWDHAKFNEVMRTPSNVLIKTLNKIVNL